MDNGNSDFFISVSGRDDQRADESCGDVCFYLSSCTQSVSSSLKQVIAASSSAATFRLKMKQRHDTSFATDDRDGDLQKQTTYLVHSIYNRL